MFLTSTIDKTAIIKVIFLMDTTINQMSDSKVKTNKDQLSLTNLRDALHHGERAVNKRGGLSYPVYTIQPVVQPVVKLDNRLYRVNGASV